MDEKPGRNAPGKGRWHRKHQPSSAPCAFCAVLGDFGTACDRPPCARTNGAELHAAPLKRKDLRKMREKGGIRAAAFLPTMIMRRPFHSDVSLDLCSQRAGTLCDFERSNQRSRESAYNQGSCFLPFAGKRQARKLLPNSFWRLQCILAKRASELCERNSSKWKKS